MPGNRNPRRFFSDSHSLGTCSPWACGHARPPSQTPSREERQAYNCSATPRQPTALIVDRETAPVKGALSGPSREPRGQNVELIGCCQSVRRWSSLLGLRTGNGGAMHAPRRKLNSRVAEESLDTLVARTHMYTYDAKVWGLSLIQEPFSVIPFQTRNDTIRFFLFPRCYGGVSQLWSRTGEQRRLDGGRAEAQRVDGGRESAAAEAEEPRGGGQRVHADDGAHERRRGDHGAVRREGQHRLPCTPKRETQ
jgi:hypothetical protein